MCRLHFKDNSFTDFPMKLLFVLSLAIHYPSQPTLLRHSLTQALLSGAGIFSLLSIAYSNWPRLRVSTNPEWMNRSHGNLRLTANRNFTYFFVTHTNILTFLIHSICPHGQTRIYQETLPYPCTSANAYTSHGFGNSFKPRSFFSAKTLDQ